MLLGGGSARAQTPTISSFSPTSGPSGTTVIIIGTNLTNVRSVLLRGIPCNITPISAGQASFNVPAQASTGKFQLTTTGGTVLSGSDFTVTRASTSLTYALRTNNFNSIAVGTFSTPAFTDLDHDGLIDLLVGSETDGLVSHYEQSSANSTSFTLRAANLSGFSGHYNSLVSVTDIDGDGLLDIVVGSGAGNFKHYEQSTPNGTSFTLLANDFNNIFSAGGLTYQIPHFTDVDSDGLLDLLVGDEFLSRYEQTAANGGTFSLLANQSFGPTVDANNGGAAACVVDLDGNGRLDMLVGGGNGRIAHYQQNSANSTAFTNVTATFSGLNMAGYTAPAITDLDGDGLLDMLVGGSDGALRHFEQLPPAPTITSFTPTSGPVGTQVTITGTNLTGATAVTVNGTAATLGANTATSLAFTVGMGSTTGAVSVTTPGGTATGGTFTVTVPPTISSFLPTSGPGGTTVIITGSNLSGLTSVLLRGIPCNISPISATQTSFVVPAQASTGKFQLTTTGGTVLSGTDFTVTRASASLAYALRSSSFNGINVGNFSTATFTDLDHDGLLDMLVGQENGNVSHYEQNATNSTAFTLVSANLSGLTGHYRSLASVTDIDGDGLLELLVGNGAGNFKRYEQTAANGTSFTQLDTDFNNIHATAGLSFEIPHVTDVDGDGLLDLLVGANFLSRYGQTAANGSTFTRLNNQNFGPTANASNGGAAACVTDLDGDGLLDMLVGSLSGNLAHYAQASANSPAFTAVNGTFSGLNLPSYCTPTITDLDGDGLLDLLVGGNDGKLRHYEQVAPPSISSFTPTSGPVGTSVTLTGTNLNGATSVKVNGTAAGLGTNTGTSLAFTVGMGSTTGAVSVTTPGGTATGGTFTVTSAPTALTLNPTSVAETPSANALVGFFTTTDPDAASSFTYSLVSGAGSTDNGLVNISGAQLRITTGPDFETKNSYAIRVRTTDNTNLFFEQTFTITVTDVNEAPAISPQTFGLAENAANGTVVGAVVASDPDAGTTLTYTITAGNMGGAFSFVGNSLRVANTAVLDFETTPTFALTVRVSDGALNSSATVTVNLTDVVEINNLTVSTVQNIPGGTYDNITVTGTGVGTLSADVVVSGTFVVQSGGVLDDGCHIISGAGSFTLAAGAELRICDPQGLSATATTGSVRVMGTRTFASAATYIYDGTTAQITGSGLPVSVAYLTADNPAGLTVSQPTVVTLKVKMKDLLISSNNLTLGSTAAASAMALNAGGVVQGAVTVRSYVTPNPGAAVGYRFLASPVTNTTVADFATPGFTPVVNGAYNTAPNPLTVTPYPNVFGFDETRPAAATTFGGGYFSPAPTPASQALTAPLVTGRGYSVYCPATTYDFVGALASGTVPVSGLTRSGAGPAAGWHLLGNPYPQPIDWDLATVPADMSATIYVQKTLGGSNYVYLTRQSNGNGTGTGTLPDGVLPIAQGFFGQVTGAGPVAFAFTDALRVEAQNPAHYRAATARPTLSLTLRATTATHPLAQDEAFVVFHETGATAGLDGHADGVRPGRNGGVPTLASLLPTGEELAINGLPADALATGTVAELLADVPAAGAYQLSLHELTGLAGATIVLRDRLTGTAYDLTTHPTVVFTADRAGTLTGRFALEVNAGRVTGVAASAAARARLAVWPNPATGPSVRLTLPVGTAPTAGVMVLDAAGRVVRTARLTTAGTLNVAGLPVGIYAVRVGSATARLVIE